MQCKGFLLSRGVGVEVKRKGWLSELRKQQKEMRMTVAPKWKHPEEGGQ